MHTGSLLRGEILTVIAQTKAGAKTNTEAQTKVEA
jgi:hypothetical protein